MMSDSKSQDVQVNSQSLKNNYLDYIIGEYDKITDRTIVIAKCIFCGSHCEIKVKNLKAIIRSKHIFQCRSCSIKALWKKPEYISKIRQTQIAVWSDSETKDKISYKSKLVWQDAEYRKKQEEIHSDPEYLNKTADYSRKLWERNGFRRNQEKIRSDPEWLKEHAERSRKLWKDQIYKIKQSKARLEWLNTCKDSGIERTTQSLLHLLGVEFKIHYQIGHYEFDIFVSSHNLLIECQGEYWHSTKQAKRRDAAKASYIHEYFPDYRILYLYEREFLNPNLVKQKLEQALHRISPDIKIQHFDLNSVTIMKLSVKNKLQKSFYSEPEEFLQSFHYTGFGRSAKVIYGAYLGDKLTAVCKFSRIIRQEVATSMKLKPSEVLELDRFCIHPEYQKKNFASWFISRCSKLVFEEFSRLKFLVSFADLTFGHTGIIYKAANWYEIGRVKPDYYYISEDGFILHKKTLYNRARKMGMTERKYVEEYKYTRTYGKGKIKYILKR